MHPDHVEDDDFVYAIWPEDKFEHPISDVTVRMWKLRQAALTTSRTSAEVRVTPFVCSALWQVPDLFGTTKWL